MASTGHIHPKNASVKVVCGAGTLVLSAHGNSVEFDVTADDLEATAYQDSNHNFLQGLTTVTATYSGWWSGSHATKVADSEAACLMMLTQESAGSAPVLWVSPAGSTAGSLCYVACVNVQATPMSFPADGIATMNVTFSSRAGSLTACADSIWA